MARSFFHFVRRSELQLLFVIISSSVVVASHMHVNNSKFDESQKFQVKKEKRFTVTQS